MFRPNLDAALAYSAITAAAVGAERTGAPKANVEADQTIQCNKPGPLIEASSFRDMEIAETVRCMNKTNKSLRLIDVLGNKNCSSTSHPIGFHFHALGSGWECLQGQTVRWRLFQTVVKIVRHGRLMILKISAAILAAFPRSESVARAPCGKDAPFLRRRDPGRGIFRF